MNIELSNEELKIIERLLEKELSTLGIEVRHSVKLEFKNFLKEQERIISSLVDKIKRLSMAA